MYKLGFKFTGIAWNFCDSSNSLRCPRIVSTAPFRWNTKKFSTVSYVLSLNQIALGLCLDLMYTISLSRPSLIQQFSLRSQWKGSILGYYLLQLSPSKLHLSPQFRTLTQKWLLSWTIFLLILSQAYTSLETIASLFVPIYLFQVHWSPSETSFVYQALLYLSFYRIQICLIILKFPSLYVSFVYPLFVRCFWISAFSLHALAMNVSFPYNFIPLAQLAVFIVIKYSH